MLVLGKSFLHQTLTNQSIPVPKWVGTGQWTKALWECRREKIGLLLQQYELGMLPSQYELGMLPSAVRAWHATFRSINL